MLSSIKNIEKVNLTKQEDKLKLPSETDVVATVKSK